MSATAASSATPIDRDRRRRLPRRRAAVGRRVDRLQRVLRRARGAGQPPEEVAAHRLVQLVVERDPLVQLHQVVGGFARRQRGRLNLGFNSTFSTRF